MINEPASAGDDRPLSRVRVVNMPAAPPPDPAREAMRAHVAAVMTIEKETFGVSDTPIIGSETLLMLGGNARLKATFEGRLLQDSETAYAALDDALTPMNLLALFRMTADGTRHVIQIVEGRPRPAERPVWVNIALFFATLFSMLLVGTDLAINEIAMTDTGAARTLIDNYFLELWRGLPYALSILLILGAHELGHYFAARYHKLAVTLPYFIPLPFIGLTGTLGAFIQLRQPMRNRKQLLDIGAAGPLSGLIFAIPILLIGLASAPIAPMTPGGAVEGNSFLYALAKTITFGRFLPDGEVDVMVNQLTWAGWTGLLITALNLIPVGQLDGGHIMYSLLGERARFLYIPAIGAVLLLVLNEPSWAVWLILLLIFGRTYAAPLDLITPLDTRRRVVGILGLFVFVVTFVPVPLTVTEGGSSLPSEAVMLLTVGLISLRLITQKARRWRN